MAIIRYKARASEMVTNATASKIKLQRSVEVAAPKTLLIFTVRMRIGISAKKKFTKLINAMSTTKIATAANETVAVTVPLSMLLISEKNVSLSETSRIWSRLYSSCHCSLTKVAISSFQMFS